MNNGAVTLVYETITSFKHVVIELIMKIISGVLSFISITH